MILVPGIIFARNLGTVSDPGKKVHTGMGKGRDGTVPRFFVPIPLVLRDYHAGQSRQNLSRSRSSRRLLSRSRSHGTQKVSGQIGTRVPRDSPASPDKYKLNYIKTNKSEHLIGAWIQFSYQIPFKDDNEHLNRRNLKIRNSRISFLQ